MSSDNTENMLRAMAWERAKGELKSILHTYYHDPRFEAFDKALEDFIEFVESNGLQE